MLDKLGWIGSALLAFCGLPELYTAITTGQCLLTYTFLIMWGLGEALVLIPVLIKIKSKFLIFNYTINLICVIILLYIKSKGVV